MKRETPIDGIREGIQFGNCRARVKLEGKETATRERPGEKL
jgi:hypothetical protein